ncbi:tyrosine-type recombinase/integrase [Azotobacter salinestris]|uniref:tyrosine-type recombinase/integrase n=1 Tax=Azotobacter salinestris TaxID=69964 RepID=UPI0032E010AA
MARRTLMTEMEAYAVRTRKSEPVGSRGKGTLLLERKASGAIMAYYRERTPTSDSRLPLGTLARKPRPSTDERTLSELRAEALRVATAVAEAGSLAYYLEQKAAAAESVAAEQVERQRLAEIEASRGTFADLFRDYIDSRRGKVREDQIAEFERILRVELEGKFPSILALKARDVRPDHIRQLLEPIWERDAKRQASKVRSFLRAAFQFGLTAEHSLGRTSRKTFSLSANPVDAVLVPDESKPGIRSLSDAELRQFWSTIESTEGVGPVMAQLFKFVIATGGQRIEQVAREPWSSYDLEARTLRLIDAKGRGGIRRDHLVPLTDRALAILAGVRRLNAVLRTDGEVCKWPWTSTGQQPFVTTSFAHATADWCRSEHAFVGGEPVERFTPRDLRRTCAQLMQRYGIDDRLSDLLQSHGQTGIVGQHYRNNPEAYLPEKRRAIDLFDKALEKVLGEDDK